MAFNAPIAVPNGVLLGAQYPCLLDSKHGDRQTRPCTVGSSLPAAADGELARSRNRNPECRYFPHMERSHRYGLFSVSRPEEIAYAACCRRGKTQDER